MVLAFLLAGLCFSTARATDKEAFAPRPSFYADGHSRPRALAQNFRDGHLYVALSTQDEVAVLDTAPPGRVLAHVKTGPFPQALAVLPGGEVLVVCRYEAALGVIPPYPEQKGPQERYRRIPAGAVSGRRGLAVHPQAAMAYLASPAEGGVVAVSLLEGGSAAQQLVLTGLSPHAVRVVPDPQRSGRYLLLCANFLEHTVVIFELDADGRIGDKLQSIATAAPVQDMQVVALPQPTLLLLTHEDRPVDRSRPFVAGLDSVILALPAAKAPLLPAFRADGPPFLDAGSGHRLSLNLSERSPPLVKLDALAYDPVAKRLALCGAASDNALLLSLAELTRAEDLLKQPARTLAVGRNPVALAWLGDGRLATADRLGDTVSILTPEPVHGARFAVVSHIPVGEPRRTSPAELGELLFYSRALLPHNVATGDRSLYTCSACHDDGHVDGRLHPARNNRFYSMTKTCRGIANTAPYLFLGEINDLDAFAKNIVSTHAQGADSNPLTFDQYKTAVPAWRSGRFVPQVIPSLGIRQAMAAYLRTIPPEPSPYLPLGATALPQEARRGLALFQKGCARCHKLVPDSAQADDEAGDEEPAMSEEELERRLLRGELALTSRARYAVGPRPLGVGGNNPPSLHGVWDNAPYFSDGSAATLEEVLRRSTLEPGGAALAHDVRNSWPTPALSAQDRADLLSFLLCL